MTMLDEIGLNYGTDKASSHHDYLWRYGQYFAPLRDLPVNVLEIGVQFGFSVKMWADYFHRGEIYGVDIADSFRTDNPHIHLFQGNAGDPGFWSSFQPGTRFDLVIDDGEHRAVSQQITFKALWPRLVPGGFYVIEDVATWWDKHFDSAVRGDWWLGALAGMLNENGKLYHGKPELDVNVALDEMETSIEFIHLYPGLVILKKRLTNEPLVI